MFSKITALILGSSCTFLYRVNCCEFRRIELTIHIYFLEIVSAMRCGKKLVPRALSLHKVCRHLCVFLMKKPNFRNMHVLKLKHGIILCRKVCFKQIHSYARIKIKNKRVMGFLHYKKTNSKYIPCKLKRNLE